MYLYKTQRVESVCYLRLKLLALSVYVQCSCQGIDRGNLGLNAGLRMFG